MKPDSAQLDLERLTSNDDPGLHEALGALKQRLPDAEQLAALASRLSALGLPVAPPTPMPATPPQSATRLKLLIGAGVVGPLTLALLLWPSARPHATVALGVTTSTNSAALPAASANPPSTAATAISSPLQAASATLEDSTASAIESSDAPVPSADVARVQPPPVAIAAPTLAGRSVRSTSPPERGRASLTSPSAITPSVVARPTEVGLLRDAQLALRTNPTEALALTEQHVTLFGRGAMVQERELIAISALARLGRHTAVLARAARFERDFPNSPYRKQISLLAQ